MNKKSAQPVVDKEIKKVVRDVVKNIRLGKS
jgi:hypothetical protein